MFGNYGGKDQISRMRECEKFGSNQIVSMWIEYGSIVAVFIVIECAARTGWENSIAANEVNKNTRNMILWMFFENVFCIFFSLSSAKIDFVSFKVQWNAWFSLKTITSTAWTEQIANCQRFFSHRFSFNTIFPLRFSWNSFVSPAHYFVGYTYTHALKHTP